MSRRFQPGREPESRDREILETEEHVTELAQTLMVAVSVTRAPQTGGNPITGPSWRVSTLPWRRPTLRVETSTLPWRCPILRVAASTLARRCPTLRVAASTLRVGGSTLAWRHPTLRVEGSTLAWQRPALRVDASTLTWQRPTLRVETSILAWRRSSLRLDAYKLLCQSYVTACPRPARPWTRHGPTRHSGWACRAHRFEIR